MAETKPEPPNRVQELIRRLQKDYGLRQEDIERETDIPQTRVSRWSRGLVPPGANDVFKLIELEQKMKAKGATPAPTP